VIGAVILSVAKDLRLRILRPFAVCAAQGDGISGYIRECRSPGCRFP
jgi:hypothetical protein